jgi:hypothetical protein
MFLGIYGDPSLNIVYYMITSGLTGYTAVLRVSFGTMNGYETT